MTGQLLKGVSHESYHQDDLPGSPHFSRGVAVRLLNQSPLHAWQAHPKLGAAPEEVEEDPQKQARKEMGALIHLLLLGGGQRVALCDYKDWRTDASKADRQKARSNGLLPVLKVKHEHAKEVCRQIEKRLESLGIILAEHETEVTALWDFDPGDLLPPIPSKGRLDMLMLARGEIHDLKIVDAINLKSFEWGIKPYGLDIQASMYTNAVETVHKEIAGRVSFDFLLCERLPPYDVAIVPLAPSKMSLGETRARRAAGIWRRCLASGKWGGFGRCAPVEAKEFELRDEMDASYGGDPDFMKGD